MRLIKNLLAIIGLSVIVLIPVGYLQFRALVAEFDQGIIPLYREFITNLLTTGNPGNALVLAVPVKEGLTIADVKESLKSLANSRNFLFVGEAPFYKQIEAITGEPYRYIEFLSFCDAQVGKMMADYNNIYTAFMPCRISLVEDLNKKLWLYTMRLDLMIHGGKPLPEALRKEALRVWKVIQEIVHGAAVGDF